MLDVCSERVRPYELSDRPGNRWMGDCCLSERQCLEMSGAVRNGGLQELCDEALGLLHLVLKFGLRDAASSNILSEHILSMLRGLQLALEALRFLPKVGGISFLHVSLSYSLFELTLQILQLRSQLVELML